MRLLDYPTLAAEYAEHHRTEGNRACHLWGVPLITYAVIALTMWGPVPLAAAALPLYFFWNGRIGALMTMALAFSAGLAGILPSWTAWAALAAGIVFQYVGHAVYEKSRPAFADNLIQLLVGPAWVAVELARPGKRR